MRYSNFSEVDWTNWQPKERATLLFVLREGQTLLIHKKRGLGAGKINGPGGRLEEGETPLAAAIRETQEELCITPTGIQAAGELRFQFVDGFSIHGYVFTATGYTGDPQETNEAIPTWVACDALPYHRMWADDRVWMPLLLQGKKFSGRFLFDGDQLLGCDVELSG